MPYILEYYLIPFPRGKTLPYEMHALYKDMPIPMILSCRNRKYNLGNTAFILANLFKLVPKTNFVACHQVNKYD